MFSMMFSAMLTIALQDGDNGVSIRYCFDGKSFNLRRLQAKSKVQTEVLDEFLFAVDMAKDASIEEKCKKVRIKYVTAMISHSASKRLRWYISQHLESLTGSLQSQWKFKLQTYVRSALGSSTSSVTHYSCDIICETPQSSLVEYVMNWWFCFNFEMVKYNGILNIYGSINRMFDCICRALLHRWSLHCTLQFRCMPIWVILTLLNTFMQGHG